MQIVLNGQKPCCLYRNHGIFPVDLAIELNVLIQERNLVHAKGQKLFSELRMGSKGVDKYRILTVLIVMGSKRAEEPAKMF